MVFLFMSILYMYISFSLYTCVCLEAKIILHMNGLFVNRFFRLHRKVFAELSSEKKLKKIISLVFGNKIVGFCEWTSVKIHVNKQKANSWEITKLEYPHWCVSIYIHRNINFLCTLYKWKLETFASGDSLFRINLRIASMHDTDNRDFIFPQCHLLYFRKFSLWYWKLLLTILS